MDILIGFLIIAVLLTVAFQLLSRGRRPRRGSSGSGGDNSWYGGDNDSGGSDGGGSDGGGDSGGGGD